jgi:outer membrane protein TolC
MKQFLVKSTGLCACLLLVAQAGARNLTVDFQNALQYDPSYQTAVADSVISMRTAKQSRSIFYPEATFSTQRLSNDTGARFTLNVTQPLLDWQRIVILGQAAPQEALGEASLLIKQHDLAVRLLKAGTDIMLANESMRLNDAKLEAVAQQALRATRLLQLGQGTVTDLRDIQVKLSQARAQQFAFQTQLQTALKQYASMTGTAPVAANFVLPMAQGEFALQSLEAYTDLGLRASPLALAARLNVGLAESEVTKIKASFLPSVSAQYAYNHASGTTTSATYLGLGLSVPLKAGTYYGMQAAEATVIKTREALRETESKIRLDADKLRAVVESGLQALKIQREAIAAAELSVEANSKSYQGGVRTAIDVLNAIQTVFQVKSEYVSLATTQAQNILALVLLVATPPKNAVSEAQRYLFGGS